MNVVILLGAPGSGKGTAAARLAGRMGARHVSTGDMLRAGVAKGTPAGVEAKRSMDAGELVPDTVVVRMIGDVLDDGGADDCYLMDGFPRTVVQAEQLDAVLSARQGRVEAAILLDVPDETLIERMVGRRICPQCRRIYHVRTLKPKTDGVCDDDGAELIQRDDDTASTVRHRLSVYARQTEAVIERYRDDGLLVTVDGRPQADVVAASIATVLGERRG